MAVAFAPTLTWAMVAIVPMGAASVVFASTANSTLQMETAPAMRGRVMALFGVVFLGSTPIGGPLMGYVAEHMGTRAAMAIAGAVTLIAAIFALRKRLRSEAAGVLKKAGTTLSTRRDGRRPPTRSRSLGLRKTRRSEEVPERRPDHRSSSSSSSRKR